MSSISSYNNDKMVMGEVEYPAMDPASGAFFQPDLKKNEDLKLMLDGSKDSLKLEAMKRIIGMIAKGRDASDLFPAVVKNVVSKNIEVKKLVYVYLVRYAEEQQDLALLSISTFQRALKDPNQLIRACALRVLSSIRVPMIVPIVTLAIRDAACDMSPYVRKTAAHAIPKLYSLDPEQKEDLVGLIARLLADRAPLVVGSAAGAYSEVCPHRIDIIHGSYRKLCGLLTDVDEWGQLTLLNVLTVYVRMCFPDPNTQQYSDSEPEKPFYHSDSSSSKPAARTLDADHRLLLRAAKSLLQSRNAGVVMAVAQLYVHCAPANELPPVAKALVRLLRAPVEVQSVVLKTIVCLTNTTPGLFEPFLKSFFVRNSDPTHIKLLKLEILTNLATETSAPVVLRELHAYLTANDKTFCAATVQAIGRLAAAIPTHTDTCLRALLKLLASKHESLVCESVVVIKRVVSLGPAGAAAAVSRAARLLPRGSLAPAARAAAVWLLAEHGAGDPKAASILASCATTFADQDELVKLQLLSLAVKVALTQPATLALCSYLFTLARYDASYDVRDRARLLRRFIEPKEDSQLAKCADYVFKPNTKKPATHDTGKDRHQYTVGTLSQYIGSCANGYRALPPAPPTALPSTLRDANDEQPLNEQHKKTRDKTFYSDPDSNGSGSASESSSSETSGSEDEDGEEESDDEKEVKKTSKLPKETNNQRSSESDSGTSDSETDSPSESSSGSDGDDDDDDGSDEDDDNTTVKERNKADGDKKSNSTKPAEQKADKSSKSNLELLLELDEMATTLPTMTPTAGGLLSPLVGMPQLPDAITPVGPSFVQTSSTELLSRVVGGGLSIRMRFARAPHLYSSKLCSIEVVITNHLHDDVTDVKVAQKGGSGTLLHAFTPIAGLSPAASVTATLGVDFKDSLQPVEVTFSSSNGEVSVAIAPPVGELLRAVTMSEDRWDKEQRKLRGMTECDKKVSKLGAEDTICKTVLETANVTPITCTGDLLRFSGQLLSSQELVLVSVRRNEANDLVIANCANMAIASLLVNEVANALARNIH